MVAKTLTRSLSQVTDSNNRRDLSQGEAPTAPGALNSSGDTSSSLFRDLA